MNLIELAYTKKCDKFNIQPSELRSPMLCLHMISLFQIFIIHLSRQNLLEILISRCCVISLLKTSRNRDKFSRNRKKIIRNRHKIITK